MQSVSGSQGGYLSRRHFHNIQMRGEGETEARNGGYGEQRYSAGWWEGGLGEPDGDRGCESGVVCRGMVLPADIFIGGHATCNRARGIRTERCFAHLYPRSGDSPVRRPFPVRSTFALREPFFYSLSAQPSTGLPRHRATGMTYWSVRVFGVLSPVPRRRSTNDVPKFPKIFNRSVEPTYKQPVCSKT